MVGAHASRALLQCLLQVLGAGLSPPWAAAASGTVLFSVAPCAGLRVLTGAQARLLQVLGARLWSPSPATALDAVLFFVSPRAWPLGRCPGAPRSPAAPPAGARLLQVLGARLSSLSPAAAGGAVFFFVMWRAWPRVLASLGRGSGVPRSPAAPPAGHGRTSLVPVAHGSKWRHSLFCHAARLSACPNSIWSGRMCYTLSCSASCRCSAHVSRPPSAAATSGAMQFFVVQCSWLRVLKKAQAHCALLLRLLQVPGGHPYSLSPAALGSTVLLLVAPRTWPRILTPIGRSPRALRSPAAPPADTRCTSLFPVAGGSRCRRALFCHAARLVACPKPTWSGSWRTAPSCSPSCR